MHPTLYITNLSKGEQDYLTASIPMPDLVWQGDASAVITTKEYQGAAEIIHTFLDKFPNNRANFSFAKPGVRNVFDGV